MPAITKIEYEQRLERARTQMTQQGLDALLLGTGMNLAYFSGYPSPAKSVARPFFVLLPSTEEPIFFSHWGHRAEAARFSWIKDVRDYGDLSRVPVTQLRDALSERALLGKTLGMELGFEQSLDISILEFERLKESLGVTRIRDASGLLWRLRMIKSEAEIACIRSACQITSDAYRFTFRAARESMLETQVYKTMHGQLDRPGAGSIFLMITSGPGNYDLVTKPPEERPIRRGDMVWMDAGVAVGGYWSDFSRAGLAGKPSAEQTRAQETIQRLTWDAVQQVRPGVKCSDLARFCYRRLDDIGFPITSSIGRLASRIGHGLGLNITEPPHLGEHDDTPLQPGMVITLEPGVATEYGTFHIEENVLVTQDGCEVLSNSPRELADIAVE